MDNHRYIYATVWKLDGGGGEELDKDFNGRVYGQKKNRKARENERLSSLTPGREPEGFDQIAHPTGREKEEQGDGQGGCTTDVIKKIQRARGKGTNLNAQGKASAEDQLTGLLGSKKHLQNRTTKNARLRRGTRDIFLLQEAGGNEDIT